MQSQSILRYLARRSDLAGQNRDEEVQADMISEAINDLIMQLTSMPFVRNDPERLEVTRHAAREKFKVMGARFETILEKNGGVFLVGNSLTYVDILMAHAITWYVEELGPEILDNTPQLVGLQNGIISLPEIQGFIRSKKYYPVGDSSYARQVRSIDINGDILVLLFLCPCRLQLSWTGEFKLWRCGNEKKHVPHPPLTPTPKLSSRLWSYKRVDTHHYHGI